MRIALMVGGLLLIGCGGDPRLEFIGTYKGPGSTIVKFSDGTSERYPKGEATLTITAPESSDKLLFNGSCALTATVNSDTQFTFDKRACPSERITFGSPPVSCDLTETITGGTGTRNDSTLTISFFGESTLSRCSDGGPNDRATYTTEMTVTRQ
jgi:hypothetical protein